jgi:hypothetical protein
MGSIDILKQLLIFKKNKECYSNEEREVILKEFRKELHKSL